MCVPHHRSFELDMAAHALELGTAGSRKRRVVIQAIGDAKATRLGLSDLACLQVLGMARFMNWSKSGTVKAVSP